MRLMRAVLPGMLERNMGSIVNIISEAGIRGSASDAEYTASKHAVVGLTKNTAFMYAGTKVRINAVAPGYVATGIPFASAPNEFGSKRLETARAIMPGVAEAEHLAASITFLLSDDGININGAILPSDGGWSAA